MMKTNEMLNSKNDILGLLYVIRELELRYESDFAISSKNAYQKFELNSEKYVRISESTFLRIFNFAKLPKISHISMNKLIHWFTEREFNVFVKYVDAHIVKIKEANLITEEGLNKILERMKEEGVITIEGNNLDDEKSKTEDSSKKLDPERIKIKEPGDVEQKNIMSAKNVSKIKGVKGKIKQMNILGFGNKQDVES